MSVAQPKSDGASVPHAVSVVAALQSCGIRREQGHDSASIAAARAEHGWNELQEARPFPWWKRLLAQFQELVILLLLGAAIVSGAVTHAVLFAGYGMFKAGVIGSVGLVVYGAVVGFTPIILAALASRFFKPDVLRPIPAQ